MKIKIIPTLNVLSERQFVANLRAIENEVETVQIDIADGKFTAWKNWHDPRAIARVQGKVNYELHLMTNDPLLELKRWTKVKNIETVFVHAESDCGQVKCRTAQLLLGTKKIFQSGARVGLALKPNTDIGILSLLDFPLTHVLIVAVDPGKSGQGFEESVLPKIKRLRENYPDMVIEVDGGVNKDNIARVAQASADIICSGSAIFNSNASPAENYDELKKALPRL